MTDCSFHTSAPESWVIDNFPGSCIRDKRLRKRLRIVARQMARQPGDSMPRLFPNQSDMEACYRLMNHDKITPHSIQVDHWQKTRDLMHKAARDIVLIGDTSTFSWTRSDQIKGLGPVTDNASTSQGFLVHSTIAVELLPEPEPGVAKASRAPGQLLGLAFQEMHVRPTQPQGPKHKRRSHGKSATTQPRLESEFWLEPLRQLGPAQTGKRTILTYDREGDIYELLVESRRLGYDFCIRASQNRSLEDQEDQELGKLLDEARLKPALGQVELALRTRPDRKERKAQLSVSVLQGARIRSPQRPGHPAGSLPAAEVSIVRVWEQQPPEGEKALEWLLLVSGAPQTFIDSLEWVRIYALRWVIEEYHKCVKTGMAAEALQFESGKGLTTAVSIMAVVALRLVSMRDMARHFPEQPAQMSGLENDQLEVLELALKRQIKTVRDVVLAVARLGGHLNRKSDGLPGWMTLWEGMFRLQLLVEGYRLARGSLRYT